MYKYHHSILLLIFSDLYVRNNSVHEYDTRQQNLFHVPLTFIKPLSNTEYMELNSMITLAFF